LIRKQLPQHFLKSFSTFPHLGSCFCAHSGSSLLLYEVSTSTRTVGDEILITIQMSRLKASRTLISRGVVDSSRHGTALDLESIKPLISLDSLATLSSGASEFSFFCFVQKCISTSTLRKTTLMECCSRTLLMQGVNFVL
jgi:hypothetical protein